MPVQQWLHIVFVENLDLDNRWCNTPTSRTEGTVVFIGENKEPPSNRDMFKYVSNCRRSISLQNKNGYTIVYLSLYLCGECDWHESYNTEEKVPQGQHIWNYLFISLCWNQELAQFIKVVPVLK
jgi:hypothetical protein